MVLVMVVVTRERVRMHLLSIYPDDLSSNVRGLGLGADARMTPCPPPPLPDPRAPHLQLHGSDPHVLHAVTPGPPAVARLLGLPGRDRWVGQAVSTPLNFPDCDCQGGQPLPSR
jgi:hypothetical protein